MTAVLYQDGHIVLPPEANAAAHVHPGEQYHVLVSTSGVIMLRPERKHQRSLVEHFQSMRGLEIQHRRDRIPAPPAL